MSDKLSTSVPPVVKTVMLNRAQDFRTLFANQSRMRIAPGEVVVTFCITDDVPNVGPILTDLVGVAMTPTHAKIMATIITDTLKLYEETFGAIPPPSTTPMDPKKVDEIVKKAFQFGTQT
ncbi:MAG: DUF3467 domain-containing protein [Methylocella sp.]